MSIKSFFVILLFVTTTYAEPKAWREIIEEKNVSYDDCLDQAKEIGSNYHFVIQARDSNPHQLEFITYEEYNNKNNKLNGNSGVIDYYDENSSCHIYVW